MMGDVVVQFIPRKGSKLIPLPWPGREVALEGRRGFGRRREEGGYPVEPPDDEGPEAA